MTVSRFTVQATWAAVFFLCSITGSQAAAADDEARMRALERQLEAISAELKELRQVKTDVAAIEARTADLDQMPKFDPHQLKITAADGSWSAQLGGKLQLDATVIDGDVTPTGNGAEIRRARLFAAGTIEQNFGYMLEVEFETDDTIKFKSNYIYYKGLKPIKLKVGHFKEPFSMEELTNDQQTTFLENSLSNVLTPSYNLGVEASAASHHYGGAVGFFTDGVTNGGTTTTDWAITGRTYAAPIAEATKVVHVGIGATYRKNEDAGTITFQQRPEVHNAPKLLSTGALAGVDSEYRIAPEIALVYGPFSLQGEYLLSSLDRTMASSIDIDGHYVQASWFLTGESRAYDVHTGTFGRVDTHGGIEVAARYSNLSLDDPAIVYTKRGEETNFTVGLNYYYNPYVRLKLNYVNGQIDHPAGASPDEDINAGAARFQVEF